MPPKHSYTTNICGLRWAHSLTHIISLMPNTIAGIWRAPNKGQALNDYHSRAGRDMVKCKPREKQRPTTKGLWALLGNVGFICKWWELPDSFKLEGSRISCMFQLLESSYHVERGLEWRQIGEIGWPPGNTATDWEKRGVWSKVEEMKGKIWIGKSLEKEIYRTWWLISCGDTGKGI